MTDSTTAILQEKIVTREINYQDRDGQALIGYLAHPAGKTNLPAVLICHEWWGRNTYIEHRAEEIASHGYAVFALDMYGNKKQAIDAQTANAYMMETFAQAHIIVDRAMAGLQALMRQPEVNAECVAVIGFCYGGKVALELARSGAKVKAVATFHGFLATNTPAQHGQFHAKVLVSHGEQDSMVSVQEVEQFKIEMNKAQVDYQVDIYPNAKHGFTNPVADENAQKNAVDLGYNLVAQQQSFAKMYALFQHTMG